MGEGERLDPQVRQAGEVEAERVAAVDSRAHRATVVEQVEAPIGVLLEAEAGGPLCDGEGRGGEVGEVRRLEHEPGPALAGGDAGPTGLVTGPVERRHPPRAGKIGLGGRRRGLAPGKLGEEVGRKGATFLTPKGRRGRPLPTAALFVVVVDGLRIATLRITLTHGLDLHVSARARQSGQPLPQRMVPRPVTRNPGSSEELEPALHFPAPSPRRPNGSYELCTGQLPLDARASGAR